MADNFWENDQLGSTPQAPWRQLCLEWITSTGAFRCELSPLWWPLPGPVTLLRNVGSPAPARRNSGTGRPSGQETDHLADAVIGHLHCPGPSSRSSADNST